MAEEVTKIVSDQTVDDLNKQDAFWAAVDEKCKTLTGKLQRRVVSFHVMALDFATSGEYVVGYMYRPDLTTQLRLSDKGQAFASGFSQEEGEKVLESLWLKSESDPRFNKETDEGEIYWKGAILSLMEYMQAAIPALKKK